MKHMKTPGFTSGGMTGSLGYMVKSIYTLVNDHMAIAGIFPFSRKEIHRLNPGPPFSSQLC